MWELKPDLVIEAGIAHGGSLIFTAAMMEMMDGFRLRRRPTTDPRGRDTALRAPRAVAQKTNCQEKYSKTPPVFLNKPVSLM